MEHAIRKPAVNATTVVAKLERAVVVMVRTSLDLTAASAVP